MTNTKRQIFAISKTKPKSTENSHKTETLNQLDNPTMKFQTNIKLRLTKSLKVKIQTETHRPKQTNPRCTLAQPNLGPINITQDFTIYCLNVNSN